MIIAAVRNEKELEYAVGTRVRTIFCLAPNINTLGRTIALAHSAGKKLFIHIDLADGIGKDRAGLEFVKSLGTDGIISTRVSTIKTAKELGLFTVQRFFIVDSQSVNTTIDGIRSSKADMAEIMPGLIPKVIVSLKKRLTQPIIAGGLIDREEEITNAINSGAAAVSTGKSEFWNLEINL